MGKIAFVFAGQGSQYAGMGKSLYDSDEKIKNFYDECELLRSNTIKQAFYGTEDELKKTVNTQPCMYLAEIAAAMALNGKGVFADGCAGFSLGEISALAYSGAYSYADGFQIVTKRAQFMDNAAKKHDTAMAAVLKLDAKTVSEAVKKHDRLYAVNYNCPSQTVVSGLAKSVESFKDEVSKLGGKVIPLKVSAAFHSPFMSEASENFGKSLEDFDIKQPEIPVYSNVTAKVYGENIAATLKEQIKSPVMWQKIIENMISDGFTDFIEIGPGKTLRGLITKISKDVNVYSAADAESIEKTVSEVKCNA